MNTIAWIILAVAIAAIAWRLLAKYIRISKEEAAANVRRDLQFAEMRAEEAREAYKIPFQSLAAKRDAGTKSTFGS